MASDSESIKVNLLTYPLSRLYFITIKDNSQLWKIGKVNDWIRKYSVNYYIVKGTQCGVHYHLIAGITAGVTPTPIKSKHFHIKSLANEIKTVPTRESYQEDKAFALNDQRSIVEKYQDYELSQDGINALVSITLMLKKHWRKIADKARLKRTAQRSKDLKGSKIDSIMDYLQKNLDEPRPDDPDRYQYEDYIFKITK